MREGVQTLFSELGEGACLALCICELGKPGLTEGEAVSLIMEGMRRKYIDYDETNRENPDNCYVADRDALMNLVTGEQGWKSTREKPGYTIKHGEKVVEAWEWLERLKGRSIAHQHFRLATWDPVRNSRTVRNGAMESLRVFRRAA